MSSKGVDAVYIPCHWMSQTGILKAESLYMTTPLAQFTVNTLVMVNNAITLCYCDTKISKVQSFSIEKWSPNKLMEHYLLLSHKCKVLNFLWLSSKLDLVHFIGLKHMLGSLDTEKKCSCFLAKSHSLCHNTKR